MRSCAAQIYSSFWLCALIDSSEAAFKGTDAPLTTYTVYVQAVARGPADLALQNAMISEVDT